MKDNINPELLSILACSKCKAPVKQVGEMIICQNPACGLRYPIRNGIPIMLIEEGRVESHESRVAGEG